MIPGDQRTVTSSRLNRMFAHAPGTVIRITFVDGTLVGYSVNGSLFFTTKNLIIKYSHE